MNKPQQNKSLLIILIGLALSLLCEADVRQNKIEKEIAPTAAHLARTRLLSIGTNKCVPSRDTIRLSGRFLSSIDQRKSKIILSNRSGYEEEIQVLSWNDQWLSVKLPNARDGDYQIALYHAQKIVPHILDIKLCSDPPTAILSAQSKQSDQNQTLDQTAPKDTHNNETRTPEKLSRDQGNVIQRERRQGSLLARGTPAIKSLKKLEESSDEARSYESRQLLVISPSADAARQLDEQIQQANARIKRRTELKTLGWILSVVEFRPSESFGAQVDKLVSLAPGLNADLNHLYEALSNDAIPKYTNPKRWAFDYLNWSTRLQDCSAGGKIGLIDDGIEKALFANTDDLQQRDFVEAGNQSQSKGHATAIASLFWGHEKSGVPALIPKAKIVSAAVFSERKIRTKNTQVSTTERLVKALDWMAVQGVKLVNMSLGGPENQILSQAIAQLREKGILVVAAADIFQDGEAMHPAALNTVVSVSAHDQRERPRKKGVLGTKVNVSAPGVDVWMMSSSGRAGFQTGSSFAAPFVSAAMMLGLDIQPARKSNLVKKLDVSQLCLSS